jgi:hypothetical protein
VNCRLRFVAGTDAMAGVEQNLDVIRGQIDAHRDLSASSPTTPLVVSARHTATGFQWP